MRSNCPESLFQVVCRSISVMSDRFDESLLQSPLPDPRPGRGRAIGLATVIAAVIGLAAIWFGLLADGDGADVDDPPGSSGPSTSSPGRTTSTIPAVELGSFAPDPALLYYPTVLPEGWEVCRQLEDKSKGDRFCDPDEESSSLWLQIAVKDADTVRLDRGQSTGDPHGGVWLENDERIEVAYQAGQFLVVVVSTESDLTADDVLVISDSIPLVGARDTLYGAYELPLDLDAVTDEQLAELVSEIDSDPRIAGRRTGEAQIFMSDGSLSLFFGDGYTVPDYGPTLPLPYLGAADRPLVVGESLSRGIAYAVWDQRGFGWRLETQGTATDIEAVAIDLIARIAALETN